MDLVDRIYRMHRILRQSRYPVPHAELQERLECSRATVNRILREMRVYFSAPIEYDWRCGGYRYTLEGEHPYELPGLWFNATELRSLLTIHRLLSEIQPGLLETHLAPLRERIERILQSQDTSPCDISRRIRILHMASRSVDPEHFQPVAGAVLQRKRLHLIYHGRGGDKTTTREVSPQRLAHYRDNWYLDAWDHAKRALRIFSVDRIKQARVLDKPAKEISDAKLNAYFATAFGIFAGKPKHTAVLRFSQERSRWVADETWHPQQKGRHENGHYVLEVPYADSRELVMDILKHMPEVEVIAPASLRAEVVERLKKALEKQQCLQTNGSKGRRKGL